MTLEVHTIQLRGPWQARANATAPVQLNIRSADDWNGWLVGDRFSGRLSLIRKFNWTFPQTAPVKIHLVVDGRAPDRITLNDRAVDLETGPNGIRVDITGQIQSSNRVRLEYELQDFEATDRLIESVTLQAMDR